MTTHDLAQAIRFKTVLMTHLGGASHVASGLSIADILAVLYGGVLRIDPADPADPRRDRLILSKGHAAAALYATLALRGFFPGEWLEEYHRDGSHLGGHVTAHGVPGVEISTGSLGHGLPVGVGMAITAQRFGPPFRVVVVVSDGECDEGSLWEAAMLAAHHGLRNLLTIVDYNKLQSLDTVANTVGLEPLASKWRAFGWDTVEIDGHDHAALATALSAPPTDNAPRCVVAHTTKGKGMPEMENRVEWHYRSPTAEHVAWARTALMGQS